MVGMICHGGMVWYHMVTLLYCTVLHPQVFHQKESIYGGFPPQISQDGMVTGTILQ